jgi:hypothetical protein
VPHAQSFSLASHLPPKSQTHIRAQRPLFGHIGVYPLDYLRVCAITRDAHIRARYKVEE